MEHPRVRTYLDPDAVGPLPRSSLADDSDALSAARTVLRVPEAPSQEILDDDVIEVVDPRRKPSSLVPVGFDTGSVRRPRKLGPYVVGVVALALAVLVVALLQGPPKQAPASARAPAQAPTAPAAPTGLVEVRPALAPTSVSAAPAATTGVLRLDSSVEGQRVLLDGNVLGATAAMLPCGPHELAVGGNHVRTVDVPCGGEITVFR